MANIDLRPRALKTPRAAPIPAGTTARRAAGPALVRRQRGDTLFHGTVFAFGALVLVIALVIVVTLVVSAWPSLTRFGPGFLAEGTWNTHGDNPDSGAYGALVFIFGTVYTSLLALLLAVPLSLGVAIFLAEVAPPWLRGPASALVELLAAVPSVVYGLWGIFVLNALLARPVEPWLGQQLGAIPLFRGPPYGSGILAAGLILTVMVGTTITAVSRDLLRA